MIKSGQEKNAAISKVLEKTECCAILLGECPEWLNCNARGKNPQKNCNCKVIGASPRAFLLFLYYFLRICKMFDLLGHFRSYSPNTMYFR